MKNVIRIFICISISLIALNCANDEKMPANGRVQFAVSVAAKPSDGGRMLTQSFPEGAYISLSVETASGVSVFSLARFELMKIGDEYITAPIDLREGNYRLTDFMIMSKEDDVLCATPKQGSDLAKLVLFPLPHNFTIVADGVFNMNVQVVDVNQQSPQDFGYISFGVEVVASDFSVSLFIRENNEMVFTSGTLSLYQHEELVYTQSLGPQKNAVLYKGDPDETYTLVVEKVGYTIRSREYTLKELQAELAGMSLVLILEPAFTMRIIHHSVYNLYPPFAFEMVLNDESHSHPELNIDWGDGKTETYRGGGYLIHYYAENLKGKQGFVNITGDLDAISKINFNVRPPLAITKLDLTRLTALSSFSWTESIKEETPSFMDFSKNIKLAVLELKWTNIEQVDLSNNPLLIRLDVSGTEISEQNLNEVILDLHHNAVTNHLLNGVFACGKSRTEENVTLQPLSQESKSKLIDLRDNYAWIISPNPE